MELYQNQPVVETDGVSQIGRLLGGHSLYLPVWSFESSQVCSERKTNSLHPENGGPLEKEIPDLETIIFGVYVSFRDMILIFWLGGTVKPNLP